LDAVFFDADATDLDLFVVTAAMNSRRRAALLDRLYLNDGEGQFCERYPPANLAENGACVAAADLTGRRRGLFVGGPVGVGAYGLDPPSFLYVNDGSGAFKNYTQKIPRKPGLGMVTMRNGRRGRRPVPRTHRGRRLDAGHYFQKQRGKLVRNADWEIPQSAGWWNCIKPVDVDGDKDLDFVWATGGATAA
jgi:hypothetical protein